MGSFDTSKTDEILKSIFTKKPEASTLPTGASKEEQAIELMRGMSPEQIMSIIAAINK